LAALDNILGVAVLLLLVVVVISGPRLLLIVLEVVGAHIVSRLESALIAAPRSLVLRHRGLEVTSAGGEAASVLGRSRTGWLREERIAGVSELRHKRLDLCAHHWSSRLLLGRVEVRVSGL